MVTEVILPKLGQTMEEGVIVEWVKKEGDPVKRGELIFTVESDKAVLDVEATARGFLRKILVPAGVTVPVLSVVALITRKADEPIDAYEIPGAPAASAEVEITEGLAVTTGAGAAFAVTEPAQEVGRIFASPRARKTAREKGVDLALVSGSGPSGRIVERDVPMAVKTAAAMGVDLTALSGSGVSGRIMTADVSEGVAIPEVPQAMTAPAVPMTEVPEAESVPLTGIRRTISERMAASHQSTARVTLVTEADATAFVEAREQLKAAVTEEWGYAPGYNDLLALMVARALREFPYMNARLSADGQSIERLPAVNLGMAVDTERGLLVPVVRNADQKRLRAFGTEFRALVERGRAGKLLPDDLRGGSFTITNLGMYDVDAFTPIINLPEAAILGVGRIQPKAVVRDGEIVARQMWTLSLTFDHRLVDGAPAARFLQHIKQLVENPFLLLG
jgi:pyruvate dehydrogenase E2 component (dihydrolipoamide acetyltransferase)